MLNLCDHKSLNIFFRNGPRRALPFLIAVAQEIKVAQNLRKCLPVTDIFLLKNSATPPRAVALRPCKAPCIRFSPGSAILFTNKILLWLHGETRVRFRSGIFCSSTLAKFPYPDSRPVLLDWYPLRLSILREVYKMKTANSDRVCGTFCDLTENRTPVTGMRILCPSR